MTSAERLIEEVEIELLRTRAALSGVSIVHLEESSDAEDSRIVVTAIKNKGSFELPSPLAHAPPKIQEYELTIEVIAAGMTAAAVDAWLREIEQANEVGGSSAGLTAAVAPFQYFQILDGETGEQEASGHTRGHTRTYPALATVIPQLVIALNGSIAGVSSITGIITPAALLSGAIASQSVISGIITATAEPETTTWQAAVIANGGTVSAATLAAVNTRIVAAKAKGYWTKLLRTNWFCGDQLAACLVPIKVGGGNATDTNVNFVGGDYSEATGLTGNGTTKRLRTGIIPSTMLTLNDTHAAVYNRTISAVGGGTVLGAQNAATNALNLLAPYTDGKVYSDQYDGTAGGGRMSVAITGAPGCVIATRTAANSHKIYRAGVEIATSATTGGGRPTVEMFIFAQNADGTPGFFSAHSLAGYSIGSLLTAQNALDYATDEEVFQDALGRGVA